MALIDTIKSARIIRVSIMIAKYLMLLLLVGLLLGCESDKPEEVRCARLHEIGLSPEFLGYANQALSRAIDRPSFLKQLGRRDGWFRATDENVGLDWKGFGLQEDALFVELYGKSINYDDLKLETVKAVLFGDGFGYMLIYRIDPSVDISEILADEVPGTVKKIQENVFLSCQFGRD